MTAVARINQLWQRNERRERTVGPRVCINNGQVKSEREERVEQPDWTGKKTKKQKRQLVRRDASCVYDRSGIEEIRKRKCFLIKFGLRKSGE